MTSRHIGAKSDQGPFRSANEDACWVSSPIDPLELGELYIVADGVGGQENGAAAAQLAVHTISQQFYHLRDSGVAVSESLSQAIHQANEAIYEETKKRGITKMGCTIVVAVWHNKTIYTAHVGDARIYLLHKNQLHQLTRDDSWVQKQLDAGIITPEEAVNHQLRNVVTQVLGNKLDITVHQSQRDGIDRQDRLLLCSDGLHGVLDPARLTELLQIDPPQTAVDALVQEAITAGTQDNVTAVVVQLDKQSGAAAKLPPLPLWAIVTLITLFLFLAAWGGWALWSSFLAGGDGQNTDSIPTSMPTAQPPIDSQPTETIVPTATVLPPTATTASPTAVPPTATASPPPTAIPSPAALRGEIVLGTVYLWSDDQILTTSCDQIAEASLPLGAAVLILVNDPIDIQGPDNGCGFNRFIKIQAENDSTITGWALESNIKRLLSNN